MDNKIKKFFLKKNKPKRVPVILQMENVECGAVCLAMILAYYKKFVPIEQLRLDCNVSRDGSNAKYIILAGRYHKLEANGFRMSIQKLKKETDFPVIIHWEFNHFVVLCGFEKNKAIINDPASGRLLVDMADFDRSFTGIVLKFTPTNEFVPSGKSKNSTDFIKKRLKNSWSGLIIIILMGFILSILAIVKTVFFKVFTDNVLIGGLRDWIKPIVIGMFLLLIVQFIAENLKNICLAKLQSKMSISSSSLFMWHVLRLPVEFFSQRFSGDIASRQKANNEIAYQLCNNIVPIFLNVIMVGIYFVIMLYYNIMLASIGIISSIINIVLIKIVSEKNLNASKSVQRNSGKLSGVTISAISMIETIKSSGAEFGLFEKIAGYRTKYNNSMLELRKGSLFLNTVPEILSGFSTGTILILGVYFIFNGDFTIGSLMAFQGFMDLFLSPVGAVVNSIQCAQEVGGSIQSVDDVMSYPIDTSKNIQNRFSSENNYQKLSGNIEIKNLCFAYSPLAPDLIKNFSLRAEKGEIIALVGGSGSGKSTIAKIISGLYKPRNGEIFFDDKPISQIDKYVFNSSVAVVDQNISLFSGTIKENITMWDTTITDEVIISACKDACIHDNIISLVGGYDYMISEGGENFSGGQRQRLEIARAFVSNPSILILDEATSALDPETEKFVMDSVKQRGITCFIIAHRLSTIRDADKIIMLEYGAEVERGTHKDLMNKDGKYANLVRNE